MPAIYKLVSELQATESGVGDQHEYGAGTMLKLLKAPGVGGFLEFDSGMVNLVFPVLELRELIGGLLKVKPDIGAIRVWVDVPRQVFVIHADRTWKTWDKGVRSARYEIKHAPQRNVGRYAHRSPHSTKVLIP